MTAFQRVAKIQMQVKYSLCTADHQVSTVSKARRAGMSIAGHSLMFTVYQKSTEFHQQVSHPAQREMEKKQKKIHKAENLTMFIDDGHRIPAPKTGGGFASVEKFNIVCKRLHQ